MLDRATDQEHLIANENIKVLESQIRSGATVENTNRKSLQDLATKRLTNWNTADTPEEDKSNTDYQYSELVKIFGDERLREVVSGAIADLVAIPEYHVLTGEYWESSEYSPQNLGKKWRPIEKTTPEENSKMAGDFASNFLPSKNSFSNFSYLDKKYKSLGPENEWMEKTYKYTKNILSAMYNICEVVKQGDAKTVAAKIALEKLPPGLVSKSLSRLFFETDGIMNRRYKFAIGDDENDWSGDASERGKQYFEEWLLPVLPGLKKIYEEVKQSEDADKMICIFLDRDARPLMHAFKSYIGNVDCVPLMANSMMLERSRELYRNASLEIQDQDISNPDLWTQKINERLDKAESDEMLNMREIYGKLLLRNRLKGKTRALVVDIGHYGTGASAVSYILSKSFPETTFTPVLAYGVDSGEHIRTVAPNSSSWGAELSLPKAVHGLFIENGKAKYLRNRGKTDFERDFYKSIILEVRKLRTK